MTRIHAIRTGSVQVRQAQMSSKGQGMARMANLLIDPEWTEWLPIYAWLIEHRDGVVLVDTGETARVHELGYHPRWHPFYQRAVRFRIAPEEELGPQLRALGIKPGDVRDVVLTHLHTDHAGGLSHVVGARTWVHPGELKRAQGLMGMLNGYLPHRWPRWWQPKALRFVDRPIGPFGQSAAITSDEEILVLPTPGHTPPMSPYWCRVRLRFFWPGIPAIPSSCSSKARLTASVPMRRSREPRLPESLTWLTCSRSSICLPMTLKAPPGSQPAPLSDPRSSFFYLKPSSPLLPFSRTSAVRASGTKSAGSTCTLPLLRECGWRRFRAPGKGVPARFEVRSRVRSGIRTRLSPAAICIINTRMENKGEKP